MQWTRENIATIVLFATLGLHLYRQPAVAAGPEPLTTAAAIARSVVDETDEPPPVSLEAVVTHSDVEGTTFLRDETGSTFIFFNNPARPRLPRGERVRVAPRWSPAATNAACYGLKWRGGISSPAGSRRC